ncbi:GerAB/ArcD/ProY family transporter [Halobacillus litoralis]|uniref:GerAB/ArcD/ProY family transporter n=1 Tax=Halobacillus litoralis TaxID=45668 RepID=UPI001CFE2E44|nr:endospore germination permease [Halobacillus litoralis]
MSDAKQLTALQIIVLTTSTMIGIGIILMPRDLARHVDTPDLWISIIFGAIFMCIVSIIYAFLSSRYPGLSIFDISPIIVGKWFGFIFNFCFVIYCLIISAYILRVTAVIIKNYLLDTTPLYVIAGTFLMVSLYLIANGAGDVVRFFQLYFPIMMFMFIVLALLSTKDINIQNTRPMFETDILPLITGVKITLFSFVGIEFLLVFGTLIKKKSAKNLMYTLWTSLGLTSMLYILFIIISIGVLGVEELKEIAFPTIEMAKSIEFQGFFFERFELIFLFGWLITAFTSLTAYYFSMTTGMKKMFGGSRFMIWISGTIIYVLTLYPEGLTDVFHYSQLIQIISAIAVIAIPGILLLVSLLRRQTYVS